MVPAKEKPYLVDPIESYPLTAESTLEARVSDIFSRLYTGADLAAIEADVLALAEEEPTFHPAAVLSAQVEFLRSRDDRVVEMTAPIAAELPAYTAAQLLLARAYERLGELPEAFRIYRQLAPVNSQGALRAAELATRVAEIVSHRIDDALARGRLEDAERQLEELREWAPEDPRVLEAEWRVAEERGDPERELAAVRRLAERDPERRELAERLAELETEVGDLRAGIDRFAALIERFPDEPELVAKLERAKFKWRLQVLPKKVRETAERTELARADFALLLYWLVPEVRYAQANDPPIATDILDHPQREEIVQVISLGLMEVDESLHSFAPEKKLIRLDALRALLRLLLASETPPACLDGVGTAQLEASRRLTCERSAVCRLIPEPIDCLPAATVSGAEALELFRRTLDLDSSP